MSLGKHGSAMTRRYRFHEPFIPAFMASSGRPDQPEVGARASVVAQPSHREGLGLAAAEALCMGLPVVATDSGGARDLLPLGNLLPPGDVQGLAAREANRHRVDVRKGALLVSAHRLA